MWRLMLSILLMVGVVWPSLIPGYSHGAEPERKLELEIKAPLGCPTKPYGNWHLFTANLVPVDYFWRMTPYIIYIPGNIERPAPYTVHKTKHGHPYLKVSISADDPYYEKHTYSPYIYIVYVNEREKEFIFGPHRMPFQQPDCMVQTYECKSLADLEATAQEFDNSNRIDFVESRCSSSDFLHEQFIDEYLEKF